MNLLTLVYKKLGKQEGSRTLLLTISNSYQEGKLNYYWAFKSGLKVSQYRMNMFDPARTLGFSGSFPAKYAPMYLPAEHPKVLIMQEDPKIDNASVFRTPASATMIR